MKLINPNHVSSVPKHHTDPTNGHKIPWDSVRTTFDDFIHAVNVYYVGNNRTPPTREALEDEICRYLPRWNCTGDPNYHAPARAVAAPAKRSGGCGGCGRRK